MNTEIKLNPKCSVCKCYWKPDETDIKTSGEYCKSCKTCRERQQENRDKNKCEHNRQKPICKDCKGSQICEHDKIKSSCKDCKGSQICEHDKRRSQCRDCKGGSICEHNKRKSQCKDCKGSSICEHNKIRSICKDCGGSQICNHNTRKSQCRDCKGGGICNHNREKKRCKDCNFKYYLVNLQRCNIYRCFKSSLLDKSKHSIEYLGCDVDTLVNSFNKKMEYFNTYLATDLIMTWDNIHIDHIKPISKFNLDNEDEFLDCCHFTNLQPLLEKDNLEKSNKWTEENEKHWKENIINKEYYEIYI